MVYDKKTYMKKWREENKDKVNKWNHDKYLRHKNKYLEKHKEYLNEHKTEVNAQRRTYIEQKTGRAGDRLHYAVRTGKIEQKPCEVCGAETAEAHHDDYNKPLEVRWLCKTHHFEWHRKNKPVYKGEQ